MAYGIWEPMEWDACLLLLLHHPGKGHDRTTPPTRVPTKTQVYPHDNEEQLTIPWKVGSEKARKKIIFSPTDRFTWYRATSTAYYVAIVSRLAEMLKSFDLQDPPRCLFSVLSPLLPSPMCVLAGS
jgi:hypothetical protein